MVGKAPRAADNLSLDPVESRKPTLRHRLLLCTSLRVLALLASLVLTQALPLHAQTATAAITGTVTTSDAGPVAGVSVTIWNETIASEQHTVTDADGHYEVGGLPVQGIYQVRVVLEGFRSLVHPGVSLVANERAIVNFTLRAISEETLVVVGQVAALDRERSTVQRVVSDALVHSLPNVGRDFLAATVFSPGFIPSLSNPNISASQGQDYWANNVLVDGASHFSKWRGAARTFYSGYALESIREVQVLSSQYSAEFGESLATVTSAVTASGTNQFRGSALFFFQDDALSARPAFTSHTPPSDSARFGGALGGPITLDRTHFFGSYEGRRSRTTNIVVSPAAPGGEAPSREDEHLAFFRVDHKNSARDLLTLRYNAQWFTWHNEEGGLRLPGSGTHYVNDVHTVLASHTTLVSSAALNQFRLQFSRYEDRRRDLQPSLYVLRSGYSEQGGTLGPYPYGATPEDTWEAVDTFSYKRGAHAIKAGGGFSHVVVTSQSQPYGFGAYFFGGDPVTFPAPVQFVQAFAPSEAAATVQPRSLSGFGFVQDDWRIAPRVTVNAGLRYDIESISNVRGYIAPTDGNNWQPRLGVAWEPLDERMVVRGGIGLYTQQHLLFPIDRVALEGPDGVATVTLGADSPLLPVYPKVLTSTIVASVPRDVVILDPGFRNPSSLQATVGVEQAIDGFLVSLDYVYLHGRDLVSQVDTNAPASLAEGQTRTVAQADATRPVVPVPGGFRKVVALGNDGESWFHSLQVKVTQTSGGVQTIAAYALSDAEDRANYVLPEDSRNLDAERARANNDIRHNLSLGLIWQLPSNRMRALSGWSLSGVGQFRSSPPFTVTFGDDRNGTTQFDARPGDRNTGRGDSYSTIDLALARQFHSGPRTLEIRVEAFNLLNTLNYYDYVGALSSPYFAQGVKAGAPFRLQLAAIARF